MKKRLQTKWYRKEIRLLVIDKIKLYFTTDLSTFSNTVAIKSNTVEINNLGIYKASVFVITITKSNILAITNGIYTIN